LVHEGSEKGMNDLDQKFSCDGDVTLSFVVPVKDEEASLETLFDGIAAQANACASDWEIIFIDDGSEDGSWEVIKSIHERHPGHVKAHRFRRNLGKANALAAGWSEAQGDFVFTMDGDLQDDPTEIPRFLDKIREGYDIVTGWKKTRHDPWHKVLPSRVFNLMLSRVNNVELHDHNCGFKCYRKHVVRTVSMYGEMHRMVPSLAAMYGFRTAEIPVRHHPRRFGRSKYGFKRFLRGFLDMWTVYFLSTYRERPMHLMGIFALAMMLMGASLLAVACSVVLPLAASIALGAAVPACLVGAIIVAAMGLIAELGVHDRAVNGRALPVSESIVTETIASRFESSTPSDRLKSLPSSI
jgi:glycosyltransferase involved in cell wall biosynthesis